MSKELAYIAGLFDGEGSISVYKERTTSYRLARIHVDLQNTNVAIVKYLKDYFGGYFRVRILPSGKPCGVWMVSCKKAIDVLGQLLPYLRIKKEQARLAIEIYSLTNRERRNDFRNGAGQFKRLPKEELNRVNVLTQEIKQLNHGGINAKL